MKYKVHRVEVKRNNMQERLEQYINNLEGEVVSVIPDVRPTFQGMGATAKIDFLLVDGSFSDTQFDAPSYIFDNLKQILRLKAIYRNKVL